MNLSKANEIISLIANIGVIASIIFLGLEMSQNTDMMRSQTRNAMTENQMNFFEGIIESRNFAETFIAIRGDSDNFPTGTPERMQYTFFFLTQLRMWENEWYQYQQNLFDAAEFESRLELWDFSMNFQINREVWDTQRYSFSSDFRDLIDGMAEECSLLADIYIHTNLLKRLILFIALCCDINFSSIFDRVFTLN